MVQNLPGKQFAYFYYANGDNEILNVRQKENETIQKVLPIHII